MSKLLTDLLARRSATLLDHLAYWNLLIWNGWVPKTKDDLGKVGEPLSVFEARLLTRTLATAGQKDEYRAAAEKAVEQFGNSKPQLWAEYGAILIRQKAWHSLDALAQNVGQKRALGRLLPLAKYWKGLAAWHSNKRDKARMLFSEIPKIAPESAQGRFDLAIKLLALGQEETVHALVAGPDGKVDDLKTYWLLRTASATERRDSAARGEVTSVAFRFDTDSIPYIHNYLGTLLLREEQPALAMELATKLIEADPSLVIFRLKYAQALLLNQRFDEAESFLKGIDLFELDTMPAVAEFHYSLFRLALGRDQQQLALRHARMLDLNNYMPEERIIIEEVMALSTD